MLFLILIAATSAAPEPLRTFGDWTVGCDNIQHCKAMALEPEDPSDSDASILSVERGGLRDAQPHLVLDLRSDETATAIVVDGHAERIRLSPEGYLTVADPLRLARRIEQARRIEIANGAGKIISRVSAKGASAALRWMDTQQRRARTSSAIAAVGPKAFTGVPVTLPVVRSAKPSRTKGTARLTSKQIEAMRSEYECGSDDDVQGREVKYGRLDSATTLALIPCLVGAYQMSSVAILISNAGHYRRPMLEFSEQEQPNHLTEPEFDPRTLQLSSTYKGRGIGDCGGTDAWVWSGAVFRLIYRNRMDECRGTGDRITVWRTASHPEL